MVAILCAVEPGLSFPATRVTRVLNQLEEEIGLPKVIRVDNGPEFISKEFTAWCERRAIEIRYIQPGKPMQNGFIERFNRTFREDVLDAYWFEDLEQLGIIAEKWRYDYNFYHPHKALEYKARGILEHFGTPVWTKKNAQNVGFEHFGTFWHPGACGERGNRTLGDFVFYRCHEF